MSDVIRNAVRCFCIKDNKIVCIKTKTNKIGFIDIPGGKIEDGETMEETVIREFKEETGLDIVNPIYRGVINVAFPNIIFRLNTFIVNDYSGKIVNSEEHDVYFLQIDELLKQKRFACTIMLEPSFIKILYDNTKTFEFTAEVEHDETVKEIHFIIKDL